MTKGQSVIPRSEVTKNLMELIKRKDKIPRQAGNDKREIDFNTRTFVFLDLTKDFPVVKWNNIEKRN